ncbi:MAG: GNAT family N-acetyltransferase [bacterium]|nr:GNAT family N-acetyltransferase [bacterium]
MRIQQPENAGAFLAYTRSCLLEQEELNGLMLGIAEGLHASPPAAGDPVPVFAVVIDAADRLLAAALRTPPQRLVVHAPRPDAHVLEALSRQLTQIDPNMPGVVGPIDIARPLAAALAVGFGAEVRPLTEMTVYSLRRVHDVGAPSGTSRPAREADLELLVDWMQAFKVDVRGGDPPPREDTLRSVQRRLVRGDYLLWEDGGRPVSVAGQNRPTRNGVAIGPVYTPAEARRRGYASALVAQLCRQLLAAQLHFVTLFADRADPTANGVYRRVGFAAQGVFAEFDLVRGDGAA